MECPKCKKETWIIVNDGGSSSCTDCHITFHVCAGGIIKYESPGPSSCPSCRYTICPKCNNQTNPRVTTEDRSIICQHCKINFHHCLGTIKFGSPGPETCVFCPLKGLS